MLIISSWSRSHFNLFQQESSLLSRQAKQNIFKLRCATEWSINAVFWLVSETRCYYPANLAIHMCLFRKSSQAFSLFLCFCSYFTINVHISLIAGLQNTIVMIMYTIRPYKGFLWCVKHLFFLPLRRCSALLLSFGCNFAMNNNLQYLHPSLPPHPQLPRCALSQPFDANRN